MGNGQDDQNGKIQGVEQIKKETIKESYERAGLRQPRDDEPEDKLPEQPPTNKGDND